MFRHRILDQLRRYVEGKISADALESWVLSHYQQILDQGEREAIELAAEINALFVEQGEELISQEELDLTMSNILRREESTISLQYGHNPVRTVGDLTIRKRLDVPGQITNIHISFQAR